VAYMLHTVEGDAKLLQSRERKVSIEALMRPHGCTRRRDINAKVCVRLVRRTRWGRGGGNDDIFVQAITLANQTNITDDL
jgi:hypothetical protein